MDNLKKNEIIFRILSDTLYCEINKIKYIIKSPSLELLYKANNLEKQLLYKEKFNTDWISKEEANILLIKKGIIKPNIDDILKDLHNQVDDIKLSMFKSVLQPDNLKQLRKRLEMLKKVLSDTYVKKHSLDYVTPEGFVDICKNQFLLYNTVFYEDGRRVWEREDDVSYIVLDSIMSFVSEQTLTSADLREIARTEPWRSYWIADKSNIIGGPSKDWTEDQRTLVSYSRMYDNIFENPESPSEDIINDDDLLDGWFINRKRESEKNKKKAELENALGDKLKDADNIFMVAKDQKGAQEIFDMNSPEMRRIKAQRDKAILEHGVLSESELPDVKLERLIKVNRQGD